MNFLLFLSLLLSLSFAQLEIRSPEARYLGYVYQQPAFALDDPVGDVLLLWTLRQVPEYIWSTFTKKDDEIRLLRQQEIQKLLEKYPQYIPAPETRNTIVENYSTIRDSDFPHAIEGRRPPFSSKHLLRMLKQVIVEERQRGVLPTAGEIHQWSPQHKRELRREFWILARFSKVLVALTRGVSSSFLVTGTESQLIDYLITRPTQSVTIEEMFRTSLRINQGNVYLTLLTIENVLSRYWTDPQRDKRLVTTKLKDITNYHYKTDKFGAWYHLFGMMLYGYVEGAFRARLVGGTETVGSQILSGFEDERQETYINARGGRIGARLRRFIVRKHYETFSGSSKDTEESSYMRLNEDFSRRLKKENPTD